MNEKNQITEMFSKYKNTVYRIAVSYCKNSSTAEDILQDVFLRYMKSTPIFEGEEHEKAWFIRVSINCCKTSLTSSWYKRTSPIEDGLGMVFEEKEQSDLFYAVMDLPSKYKMVVHLFYYEDYSTKEIADILHQNVNTISTRLFRARGLLKEKLAKLNETNSSTQKSGGSYAERFI